MDRLLLVLLLTFSVACGSNGKTAGTDTLDASAGAVDVPTNSAAGGTGGAQGGATGSGGGSVAAIVSFTASPSLITAGHSSTLSWMVTGAATTSIDHGIGAVTIDTEVVAPSQTVTYTLTATDAAGHAVSAQVTVTVVPPPSITSFWAGLIGISAPATVSKGSNTYLRASFSGGIGSIDNGIGSVVSDEMVSTGPLTTTTIFTLTVTNPAQDTVTAKVTVTIATASFVATGTMTTPRYGHKATRLLDGKVLITGGMDEKSQYQASAEPYDPETGKFTATGSMSEGRWEHTATLLADGRVLVTGGRNYAGALAGAELYDPATGRFVATGAMAAARHLHTATRLSNGQVLIVGQPSVVVVTGRPDGGALPPWDSGVFPYGDARSSDAGVDLMLAELYDPATGRCTPTGSTIVARQGHGAVLLADGKVLVVGGTPGGADVEARAELYDPSAGGFAFTGSMIVPRWNVTTNLLASGQIFITGNDRAGAQGAEQYDPRTGSFAAKGSGAVQSFTPSVTLLDSGRVLVVGGFIAEEYDPGSASFALTATPFQTKTGHTATLLGNGKVLLAGGSPVPSALAELYVAL